MRDGVGAILVVLAARARLPAHHRICLPRNRARVRPRRRSAAGRPTWRANGLNGFYERPGFHDYTPGYLYVLWVVGLVGQASGGIGDLIKLPPIFADVAIGWLVWSMAIELGVKRGAALLGAGLVGRQSRVVVRLGRLGPGRFVRRRLPPPRGARAVAGPTRAGRDLDGDRGAHQAAARDPHPDRGGGHHPAGTLAAERRCGRSRRPARTAAASRPTRRPDRSAAGLGTTHERTRSGSSRPASSRLRRP